MHEGVRSSSRTGTDHPFRIRLDWGMVSVMESPPTPVAPPAHEPVASIAEDLPELYRTILDRVADLERVGSRAEAGHIRVSATRAYSNAWDASAQRVLVGLLVRADSRLDAPSRARGWSFRRRSVATR